MPELPDIALYVEALELRLLNRRLLSAKLLSPFFLRTVEPTVESLFGLPVTEVRRVGKRIALQLDTGPWLVIHLMVAGRLQWHEEAPKTSRRHLAVFSFDSPGYLAVSEAGTKRRAWLKLLPDDQALEAEDPGGLEPLTMTFAEFRSAIAAQRHTLKRALCHPALFSGIGNAYSDEILHRARLSPFTRCSGLSTDELERLHGAIVSTLTDWTARLRAQSSGKFPAKVTAFQPDMAVHGKFGEPCPVCGSPVQRIRYAQRETNYCARCQTKGQVLKDRGLSRLLKADWPARIEQWE